VTMGREEALYSTLEALAKMQKDVSIILQSKAIEAEKAKNWILNHLGDSMFPAPSDRLAACLQIHEQQIEVIDGLTKLCNGLSRNMKMILHPEPPQGAAGMGAGEMAP